MYTVITRDTMECSTTVVLLQMVQNVLHFKMAHPSMEIEDDCLVIR